MVFWIIILVVGIILLIAWFCIDEELCLYPGVVLFIMGLVFLIGGSVDAVMTKNTITDMRENPANYTIFDKHDTNKDIKNAKTFQGTIFSFYNGFDLTYIEEN